MDSAFAIVGKAEGLLVDSPRSRAGIKESTSFGQQTTAADDEGATRQTVIVSAESSVKHCSNLSSSHRC